MTIKNIEDLKNIQIVCRNQNQVKDCVNYLEQLGYTFEDRYGNETDIIIFFGDTGKEIFLTYQIYKNLYIEFYNKQLVKTLQKFIKEKEEQEKEKKEELKDFEVAEDGRIIKINNWDSDKYLYFMARWDYIILGFTNVDRQDIEYYVNLGLAFISKEARDKAMFKLEIETKLRNIAKRLNNGRKIDWEDGNQNKFFICYDFYHKYLDFFSVGSVKTSAVIYCLERSFLKVAKQEIGEENLIKYFKE